jgi:glycerol dehydrogenase
MSRVMVWLTWPGTTCEAEKATRFFVELGLPVHLGQLSLSPENTSELASVIEAALAFPFMANMVQDVSGESLLGAGGQLVQVMSEPG